jgi:nickel transport protein
MRLGLLLAALFLCASPASAHRMIVDPRSKGDQLHVEVFYEDDTPAQQAKVIVLNGDQLVAEGRTDEKGVWNCPKPPPGTYLVKAESLGHAAKATLVVSEAASAPATAAVVDSQPTDHSQQTAIPWRNVAIGLGVIGVLCIVWITVRKNSRIAA